MHWKIFCERLNAVPMWQGCVSITINNRPIIIIYLSVLSYLQCGATSWRASFHAVHPIHESTIIILALYVRLNSVIETLGCRYSQWGVQTFTSTTFLASHENRQMLLMNLKFKKVKNVKSEKYICSQYSLVFFVILSLAKSDKKEFFSSLGKFRT